MTSVGTSWCGKTLSAPKKNPIKVKINKLTGKRWSKRGLWAEKPRVRAGKAFFFV